MFYASPAMVKQWTNVLSIAFGDIQGRFDLIDLRRAFGLKSRDPRTASIHTALKSLGWKSCVGRLIITANIYERGDTLADRRRIIHILRCPITGELHVGHDPPT
jgi:hypothetical protein